MSNNIWCITQTPFIGVNGFALPASGRLVAPYAAVEISGGTRDRHADAMKQHPGTLVWSPPT
ncbi:MAG: hypothetical protein JWO46_2427 [Nocardioidaceae bacterium]|nr:hypothetical protein [Nocardioidaceae bacterium]